MCCLSNLYGVDISMLILSILTLSLSSMAMILSMRWTRHHPLLETLVIFDYTVSFCGVLRCPKTPWNGVVVNKCCRIYIHVFAEGTSQSHMIRLALGWPCLPTVRHLTHAVPCNVFCCHLKFTAWTSWALYKWPILYRRHFHINFLNFPE